MALAACGPQTTEESSPAPEATPAAETPEATPAPNSADTEAAAPAEEAVAVEEVSINLQDPVATVNGDPITKAELDAALQEAIAASGIDPSALTAKQKMEGYKQILDDMIMDRLITKAAAGVEVSQEEVAAEIAKLRDQFPTEQEFDAQLTAAGQTPEKLAETLSKIMQQREWVESQIGKSAEVSEEEVKAFYTKNMSEFERPEEVKASHILFMVKPDDSEDLVKAQLEKANAALARAKKGEDFTTLAKELSEEPGAAESGGDLGYFSKDRMVPEFSEAAFALETGNLSEPVRTQFGWHIIKVEDKKEAGVAEFEEVKEQLGAYLEADKQRKAVEGLMESLREGAEIQNSLTPSN